MTLEPFYDRLGASSFIFPNTLKRSGEKRMKNAAFSLDQFTDSINKGRMKAVATSSSQGKALKVRESRGCEAAATSYRSSVTGDNQGQTRG